MHILIRFLSFFIIYICLSFSAYAQDMLHFEAAHIIGTGNNIIVHRVPVTNDQTNESVFKDVTVEFGVAPDGSIAVVNIISADSVPLPNSSNNIIPGIYEFSDGSRIFVSVGGTTADGRTSGSFRSITEELEFSATWVTGPVEGHPLIGTRLIAPELIDGPTYGVMGSENTNSGFHDGGLITISQIDTSFVLTAYHRCAGCGDTNYAVTSTTLHRVEENQ
jgi:hypothetical protein